MFELRYALITAPTAEPLALSAVKAHLRVDSDDTSQDTTISLLMLAARRYAETYTGRSLMTQHWQAVADGFPGWFPLTGTPWNAYAPIPAWNHQHAESTIKLGRGPVQSVQSITYVDTTGTMQTLDPSTYIFDASDLEQRIAPVFGTYWPVTQRQLAAVKINFTAGVGDPTLVPPTILNWMLVRIATAYEHREAEEIVARGKLQPVAYVDTLLDSEKVWAL